MKVPQLNQQGSVLLTLVIAFPFLMLITGFYLSLAVSSFKLARNDQMHTHAQVTADAGIDYGLQELNADEDWTGTAGEVQLHNDGKIKTTYEVAVFPVGSNAKLIRSVGRTFNPSTSSTPTFTVALDVSLRPVRSSDYSIVAGVGGLVMSNNAKVLGGDVFVNGEVTMQNSAQIGLQISPVKLNIAHQSCPSPADAFYPRLCNSGEKGQPISISNPAHIYGEVKANNQTSGDHMSMPGLVSSSGVTAQTMPPHDRALQKSLAVLDMTGSDASCTNVSGSKVWPANLKVTGDVTISKSCTVIIEGDVWITGTLSMENSSVIKVSDLATVNQLLGADRPNLMIDGQNATFKNASAIVSNIHNMGLRIITYWSNSICSPDCPNVTGADLFNSKDTATIELNNSASGPHTVFYSRWSKVLIHNSGSIGALVGQTVELRNSGTVSFGTSAGVAKTYWVINDYKRVF